MNEFLKRRAALILALSIPINLLVGCSNNKTRNNGNESTVRIEISNEFNSEDLTNFLAEMSEVIPSYNLEEVFLSDEEINILIEASKNNQECDNTVLSCEELYNSIITNSLDENGLINITDEISLEDKQEIDIFIRECLKEALEGMLAKNEINLEDACVIKKLRIAIGKNYSNSWIEYYGNDKVLIIDYQKVKAAYNNYENENFRNNLIKEGLIKCLKLGLGYPRLQTCDCRLEKGQTNINIGEGQVLDCLIKSAFFSSDNNDLGNVNKSIFEYLGDTNKHNTSILLLLATFKENRNIKDLYEIVFNSDLAGLYKYFNLTTKEEIEKFYQIARTMEVITTDNEYQEEFFDNTTSTYSTAFRDYVGYGYKADIFKTSITDLMKSIASSKDINKEEAMFLYKYVKHVILNNTGLNSRDNNFEPNFAKTIISIENIFFDFLSKFYNLNLEELDELYNDTLLYESWFLTDGTNTSKIEFSKLVKKYPLLQFIEANYIALSSYIDNFDNSSPRR